MRENYLTTPTPITVNTGPARKESTNACPMPRTVPSTKADEIDERKNFSSSMGFSALPL